MNLADDIEEFVTLHRGHGLLTADAGEPTPNGYRLEIACSCGVTFERWVTELMRLRTCCENTCGPSAIESDTDRRTGRGPSAA